MRARYQSGSVVLDKRVAAWYFRWNEGGKRKAERIGSLAEFPTKTKAKREAEKFVTRINTPAMKQTRATVAEVVGRYRREKMPRRASTVHGYDCWLNNYIVPQFGDVPVPDLKAGEVDTWLKGLKLSPKSKAEIRGLLSRLLDLAMLWEYMPLGRNPMELVEVKGAAERSKKQARTITVEEFGALSAKLQQPFRTMACVALFHGLRVSELLALKWADIDWLEKTLSVERSIVNQIEADTKTATSAAKLPLHDSEIAMLEDWKAESEFTKPTDYVFASPHLGGDKPYHYNSFLWKLEQGAKAAGIPVLTTHSFRHTYRSWLDSNGTSAGLVKTLMRHADIRTTFNTYGTAIPDDIRREHGRVVDMVAAN